MANHSVREAIAAFRRAPGLAVLSAMSIGLSLFVLGTFALVTYNVEVTLRTIERRVEVVAYLRENVSAEQLEVLQNDVGSFPEVETVIHVSKFEAMRNAMQQLEEFREVFTDLEVNPLPASLEVQLRPDYRDPESVQRVAELIALYPFVEDVQYGREWVEKIYQLRRLGGAVAAILGIAFAVVAILIIGTTVRMAVLARREEIVIMQLVGATDGFIRRPFLLEGFITGLAGGTLALILTYGAYLAVNSSLLDLEWLPPLWAALGLLAGGFLGLAASDTALRRHMITYA
ncbi:MAG: permease-like cell division protein FtsX [Gemmatimonadales bacterium]|jgi:cell division transport system permease protein